LSFDDAQEAIGLSRSLWGEASLPRMPVSGKCRLNFNNTPTTGRRPFFCDGVSVRCAVVGWPGSGCGSQFRLEREHFVGGRDQVLGAAAHDVRQVMAHLQAHQLIPHELTGGQPAALRVGQLP